MWIARDHGMIALFEKQVFDVMRTPGVTSLLIVVGESSGEQ